ncbi:MAG TPA: phosphatidylglycerophosphatase A [Phycisphaerae bacterium]|nr:phosphatidylglycerophosphatase A [Phycisphaerae bacterium]HOJ75187.1 phosphatidylglycerophosphatase A [Phycisphaerae bacterium]HON66648.1 phosphatidylglycerophosphatase A [Phycisphaerae bacterium]HOQ85945.1 phosphatidylglycerophosphatase A [Phycisphaerae bacterium]HPP27736.1 phosphatidylglycerophosphatase A [Phycisphaerae bacterium]
MTESSASPTEPVPPRKSTLAWLMMSGFGLGYAPVASGTFGSAGAILVSLVIWAVWPMVFGGAAAESRGAAVPIDVAWAALVLLASAGCVVWGPWAVGYYAARARKQGDPGHVVLDEFAGQWMALVGLPLPLLHEQFLSVAAIFATQFFLFRVFDVLKPPPARQLERLPAGWGILMDDLGAGVYANIVGQILFRCVFVMN